MSNETASTAEIYDAFAEEYRAYSKTKSAYISSVDNLILERFSNKAKTMLDFGSGDGVRGARVAKSLNIKSLYQVDISPEMVNRCQELDVAERVYLSDTNKWVEEIPAVDIAVCLWNVLGHVPSQDERIAKLHDIRNSLKPGGYLCIDVNNRHNKSYGLIQAYARKILDTIWPDVRRGDVSFSWKIGDKAYPATGHFFTPEEIKSLVVDAGFSIKRIVAVDYTTGDVSDNLMDGQIFIIVEKN